MNTIEEHDVRSTTQGVLAQDPSGTCIKGNQCVGVAGAEKSVRLCIEIEAVGPRRRNSVSMRNTVGTLGVNDDDLRRFSNITE